MSATSVISTIKVDWPADRSSRGADAGENAVHDADAGGLGRDEGADLGHEHNEGHLPHIGGLARHVGAGDDGAPGSLSPSM